MSSHNEAWAVAFEEEALSLRTALAGHIRGIEHVGSTSIPDIRAKPLLDILVGLSKLDDGPVLAPVLATIRYEFRPDAGLPAEHVFAKGTPRTHILHLVEFGGAPWQQKLAFRDALRENHELARSYEALKISLCSKFAHNRAAYTAGKTEFIESVVNARLATSTVQARP